VNCVHPPGTAITQMDAQGLQPLFRQVTLVHGQQHLRQLRQPGCTSRSSGSGTAPSAEAWRPPHRAAAPASGLFILGELLDIDAQHPVNLEQHGHRERALILLDLVQIAG
jgi:hypothetical protein